MGGRTRVGLGGADGESDWRGVVLGGADGGSDWGSDWGSD